MKSLNKERRLVMTPPLKCLNLRPRRTGLNRGAAGVSSPGTGFTIIEVLIVVVILAVAALTAIPILSSAGSVQVRSAANMLMADLERAKSMAISRGQNFSVVFDTVADRYHVEDQAGSTIEHPVKKGFDYVVDMQDEGLEKVDIVSADFNGASRVQFDYLGSPDEGGSVTLQAGERVITVDVEPVTGYISVSD